ncbi:MAG: hypothetical protein WCO12_02955 [bacterium]
MLYFLVPSLFACWYWVKIGGYFLGSSSKLDDETIKKIDRKFILFIIFYITFVLVTIFLSFISGANTIISGFNAINNGPQAFEYNKVFSNKPLKDKLDLCQTQTDKDGCLMTTLILEENKKSITLDSCNLFSKEENKVVCYAIINRCDLVKEDKLKGMCDFTEKTMNETQFDNTSLKPIQNK